AHYGLVQGNRAMGLPSAPPEQVRQIYFEAPFYLDRKVTDYITLARAVVNGETDKVGSLLAVAEVGMGSNDSLLGALDSVVAAFEAEHTGQIARKKRVQAGALAVLAIVLLLEAVLIFRPLITRVENLTDELHDAALVDPLSGAYNRRGFATLGTMLTQQRRAGAVMALDIDHFKRVNDTLGHAAGDALISHVARLIRETLRDGDVIGRIGGEEFAAVLMGIGPEEAVQVAERVRRRIEASPCLLDDLGLEESEKSITVSVGVVSFARECAESLEELVHSADSAMYDAKRQGRNRVVVAPDANRRRAPRAASA
ncbi:MAG: GGDEF domain-containing protein, partial [Bacteroidota bacterium]